MHHRSPPFRWKGPASAGGGRRSQFVLRPGLRRKHMPKGEVASPQNSGDIFGNRTLSPMFINVLSAQCFGPSSCPFIHIYIWLYPDPPSNFALGLLSHLQKVCPKFYEKKLEGLGAHLDLFSKAPNQFLPDLMAVEDRCMLCRPQISSGSRLLDTWRIFAIRYCNLMKGDHLIFNWNPMTHIQ